MISRDFSVIRFDHGKREQRMDTVICENWLTITLNGSLLTEIPHTPRDIPALVTGILFTEGYLEAGDTPRINIDGSVCRVEVDKNIRIRTMRDLVDCASSRPALDEEFVPVGEGPELTSREILSLMSEFQKLPSVYHETGGVHMAAFAADGIIEFWSDDISRRNAVDKIIGMGIGCGCDFSRGLLLSSGRISSDMILRMIRARIPVVASLSAPTDGALDLARSYGITVCGFVRGFRMNVYTGSERFGD